MEWTRVKCNILPNIPHILGNFWGFSIQFVQHMRDLPYKLYNLAHAEGLPPDWCVENHGFIVQSPIKLSVGPVEDDIFNITAEYRVYAYYGLMVTPPVPPHRIIQGSIT